MAANNPTADSYKTLAVHTQSQIDKIQALNELINSPAGKEIVKYAKDIVAQTNIEHFENPLVTAINALHLAEEEIYGKIDTGFVDVLMAAPTGPVMLPSSPFASLPAKAVTPDIYILKITYCGFDQSRILIDKELASFYMNKLKELKAQGLYDPITLHDVVLRNFKDTNGDSYPSLANKRILVYANELLAKNEAYVYMQLHIPVGVKIPHSASVELYVTQRC